MLYAILILDTYLTQWLSLFASSSCDRCVHQAKVAYSPKLQYFHETCQVKENGKHLWPKCHPFRPKEKKHEFGLHVRCCSWPSSLTIHEEHLMQALAFLHA